MKLPRVKIIIAKNIFVNKILEPWIIEDIQVVVKLLKSDGWNKHIPKKEHMYIGIEEEKYILSYVGFTTLCNVIN